MSFSHNNDNNTYNTTEGESPSVKKRESEREKELEDEVQRQKEVVQELKGRLVKYKFQTKQLREALKNVSERLDGGRGNGDDGKEDWEIKVQELTLIKQIGKGNFGEVWKGEWRGCSVAIKKVANSALYINATQFRQEANIMK